MESVIVKVARHFPSCFVPDVSHGVSVRCAAKEMVMHGVRLLCLCACAAVCWCYTYSVTRFLCEGRLLFFGNAVGVFFCFICKITLKPDSARLFEQADLQAQDRCHRIGQTKTVKASTKNSSECIQFIQCTHGGQTQDMVVAAVNMK